MIMFLEDYAAGEEQQHFCDNSPLIDGLALNVPEMTMNLECRR